MADLKLKLVDYEGSVDYFGIPVAVPLSAKFIATDSDGDVYYYNDEPFMEDDGSWDSEDYFKFMGLKIQMDDVDWKETLMEIKP